MGRQTIDAAQNPRACSKALGSFRYWGAAENGDTISGILKVAMDTYLEEHGQPYYKPQK